MRLSSRQSSRRDRKIISLDLLLLAIAIQIAGPTAACLLCRFPRAATVLGAGATIVGCRLGFPVRMP